MCGKLRTQPFGTSTRGYQRVEVAIGSDDSKHQPAPRAGSHKSFLGVGRQRGVSVVIPGHTASFKKEKDKKFSCLACRFE